MPRWTNQIACSASMNSPTTSGRSTPGGTGAGFRDSALDDIFATGGGWCVPDSEREDDAGQAGGSRASCQRGLP